MEGSSLNKSQSKYYHTACLMDEALISLLEKKNYEFITVKELCEKAGVNRSTFYLHYETMDDLLSECIAYVGKKVTLKFADKAVIDREQLECCPAEDLILVTPKYLVPYLEFVKENKKVFFAVISQPKILKTNATSHYLYTTLFEPILNRLGVPHHEQKYRIAFYLNGIWAIIAKWVMDGCKEEADDISRLIINCIGIGKAEEK